MSKEEKIKIESAEYSDISDEYSDTWECEFPEGEVTLAELKKHAATVAWGAASDDRVLSTCQMLKRPSVNMEELLIEFTFTFRGKKGESGQIRVSYFLEGYSFKNNVEE